MTENEKAGWKKDCATEERRLAWESGRLFQTVLPVVNGPVMESVKAFADSPVIKSIMAIQQIPLIGSALAAAQLVTAFKKGALGDQLVLDSVVKGLEPLIAQPGFSEVVRALGLHLQSRNDEHHQSPLFQFLTTEGAPHVGKLVEAAGDAAIEVRATGDIRVATPQEVELEQGIVEQLAKGESQSLTKDQRSRLALVLWIIFSYLLGQVSEREDLCFFQPKVIPGATANQAGKFIRNFLCEAEVPLEVLGDYRSVKGVGVKLREGPGMKQPVMPITLEDRALLRVLDSENRDWLLVEVVGDGTEGWISRRYTHKLIN